jgi:RNA polymerase sigma-70 factor (ECF subfamily)
MHTTSVSLLQRLRQPGEAEAWERFVSLYTPLLYYWARKIGVQEADVSDLVQDVFALLLQKLPQFVHDRQGSFRGWLRTVTLNKWRERCRRWAPPVDPDAPLADLAVPDGAEAFWEAEYRQRLVGRALEVMQAEFQPTTWKACWQHVVEGRPVAEVAEELGLSANAVYLAKARVLRRLHQELDGLLD